MANSVLEVTSTAPLALVVDRDSIDKGSRSLRKWMLAGTVRRSATPTYVRPLLVVVLIDCPMESRSRQGCF